MNQIEIKHLIIESNLDQEFYFQSLFSEVCNKKLLIDSQIERIQIELVDLMAKQVERYTNNESSSVRVETAQQLLQACTYSIGIYLKTVSDMNSKIELLKKEKITSLFYLGINVIKTYIAEAKSILSEVQSTCIKIDNYAYHDTIFYGIPEFFHDYNIEFGSHDNVGSIDYPLCKLTTNLSGIEYLLVYLKDLSKENNFCKKFSEEAIQRLLQSFSSEDEHILVNIFELVLTNALGCALLEQNISDLSINTKDREWLQKSLEHLSLEDLQIKLNVTYKSISTELALEEEDITYGKDAIKQIVIRLKQNLQTGTLEKLFISFINQQEGEEAYYEDGNQMEDDKLRDLIEEMAECRFTVDKIAMLRKSVHNLNDLIELLDECFYEDEYEEVFTLLNGMELAIIKKRIEEETEYFELESYSSLKDWQKKFMIYTDRVEER